MALKKGVLAGIVAAVTVSVAGAVWLGMRDKGPEQPVAMAPVSGQSTLNTEPVEAKSLPTAAETARSFRFARVSNEVAGTAAETCLVFNKPLNETGAVNYADYVALPAGARAGIRVAREKLCLSGLEFGRDYAVTLRAGLPAATNDDKLPEAQDLTLSLSDRTPAIAMGQGFILPREATDGLPITTVNVDRLAVKLYRIGDRMLAQMRQDFINERSFYSYERHEVAQEYGRLVWQGEIPVKGPRNASVTTLFPLADAIGKAAPGAYLLLASNPDQPRYDPDRGYTYSPEYAQHTGQWVVQSDLGITSFRGDDGLTLSVRSLARAKPDAGVRLQLIARNNEVLAEAKTDENGIWRFDAGLMRGEGGDAPVMVMAYGNDGDFNFLDLRRPGFDLSDRGVEGRRPAGAADAFLYTERGIYRPGETVELTSILRDATAIALPDRRITIKVNRPDGKEHQRLELTDQGGGGGHAAITLPVSANRGQWEAVAYADPKAAPIGSVRFQVQDFVPQRLEVTVDRKPTRLSPGQDISLDVNARFLYGAPGAALAGEARLTLEPDPAPFPQLKGYQWGTPDEVPEIEPVDLDIADTDPAGKTQVSGKMPINIPTTRPMRADINIAIREPGGRATGDHVYVPVPVTPISIGIRPQFDGSVPEGAKAGFEIIAVDADGKPVEAKGLSWRIIKDTSTWQWFRSEGSWKYERVPREKLIASGTVNVAADNPALLSQTIGWGGYRLVVADPVGRAVTSVGFYGGWYGNYGPDRPDRLKVAADKAGYKVGDTARLRIDSDAAGDALLVIANERVHETRSVKVPAGGTDIDVKIKGDWGPGAYAMVTLYRPLTEKLGHAPVRAVGVSWLGLDPAARTLNIAMAAPDQILPRQTIQVPVTVTGAGRNAHVTLAAVDQGILQLTRFATPKPQDYFLAKRQLGVSMRDDYGRLIRAQAEGDDQGGDGFGGRGLDVVPTRTVALFSGIVALDGAGKATIPLTIPDFQGELRLMAVAWDSEKTGSADRRLTVRDPVVAEIILPRFLAPSDQGRATVLLHNVAGEAGAYRVTVGAKGPLTGGEDEKSITLATGERQIYTVPLVGTASGIGTVTLSVSGPGGFKVDRAWPIQVRPPQLPVTQEMVATLAAGETLTLPADMLNGLVPGTESASLSVSRWQGMDVPGMLRWLDRYPFGCLEQTVSRAMPLLWYNDLALMAGSRQDRTIADRVQDSVDRVLSMQDAGGEFRMWGPYGDTVDPWLSVFAMDFLELAADKGFVVPNDALTLGREWLTRASGSGYDLDVRAYAAWVLARQGKANVSDLRYLADTKMPKTALGAAMLGAALDAAGERARAGQAFDTARTNLSAWVTGEESDRAAIEAARRAGKIAFLLQRTDKYGSRLRDTYGIAGLLATGGRGVAVPSLLESASLLDTRAEETNTQEKAWMLRAAANLAPKGAKLSVTLDGAPLGSGDPVGVSLSVDRLRAGVTLANAGDTGLYRTLSVEGVPQDPLPAAAAGVRVDKSFFTLDGAFVDPAKVRQNDRIIIVLEGTVDAQIAGEYAILDLLPAGLEIEGVVRADTAGYRWLGALSSPSIAEARDDRFAAAVELPSTLDRGETTLRGPGNFLPDRHWGFRVAYAVRAVTPGRFTLPAVVVEHMYKPKVKGRTAMGSLEITP